MKNIHGNFGLVIYFHVPNIITKVPIVIKMPPIIVLTVTQAIIRTTTVRIAVAKLESIPILANIDVIAEKKQITMQMLSTYQFLLLFFYMYSK